MLTQLAMFSGWWVLTEVKLSSDHSAINGITAMGTQVKGEYSRICDVKYF